MAASQAVGNALAAPEGARIVDANGRWVTPGLIDVHSHMGVYASPGTDASDDGNEATDPVTSKVWAEHSVWPQDPGFEAALQGGITSMQILPGSANLIGGRGVTIKIVPATTYQAMKFPGAPHGLKMACGENPKRVYGGDGHFPSTRMGNVAGYRQAFADAKDYMEDWKEYDAKLAKYEKDHAEGDDDATPPQPPKRDLKLETLAEVMRGNILVHNHCYRADEMATMLDIAQEFGFRIAAFHHGVEAYKLADRLASEGVCGALWADWWGFKMEAYDGIQENIALVDSPQGGCAIVHSDSEEGIQRLNQEAAKAMTRGKLAGLRDPARARDPLGHGEPGEGARHPRPDRHARARQDGATSWSGTARRSPSTRSPTRCSWTACSSTTARTRRRSRARTSRCDEAGAHRRRPPPARPASPARRTVLIRGARVHTAAPPARSRTPTSWCRTAASPRSAAASPRPRARPSSRRTGGR